MTASAAILNLTLTCYLNKTTIFKYGELAHYLNLTLTSYVNKTAILQYGDQRANFNLLPTAILNYTANLTCCVGFKLFIFKTLGSKEVNQVPAPRHPKNDITPGYCDKDNK